MTALVLYVSSYFLDTTLAIAAVRCRSTHRQRLRRSWIDSAASPTVRPLFCQAPLLKQEFDRTNNAVN